MKPPESGKATELATRRFLISHLRALSNPNRARTLSYQPSALGYQLAVYNRAAISESELFSRVRFDHCLRCDHREQRANVQMRVGGDLDHHDRDQLFDRIDPEDRSPRTTPGPCTERERVWRLRAVGQNRAPEAEPVAVSAHIDGLVRADVVLKHQVDGHPAEE